MNLTKDQAIKEHRKMWNWIAEQYKHGNTRVVYELKKEYCSWYGIEILHDCFCCEYAFNVCVHENRCKYCPIVWGTEHLHEGWFCERTLDSEQGLYGKLFNLTLNKFEPEDAYELAKHIAELPERILEENNE